MKIKKTNPYDIWGILTIILAILKLFNVITFSWLFVFTPIFTWVLLVILIIILRKTRGTNK